jgi:hypothetical protein
MPANARRASAHSATERSARVRYRPLATRTDNGVHAHRWSSQAAIQSRYTSRGPSAKASRQAARSLLELENLRQSLEPYNCVTAGITAGAGANADIAHGPADLAQYGSLSRLPPNHVALALSAADLLALPGVIRDASRDLDRTIGKLKNGEKTHPIECNFESIKQLLNKLADLKSILRPKPLLQGKKVP